MALECLVIGLGVFGKSLAENLKSEGAMVVGLDINEKFLKEADKFLDQSVKIDATQEDNLRVLGIDNFDYIFVCIGVNMQASLIITLHLNNLGARKIIARSNSFEHSLILQRLGAHRVISPETEMGARLAQEVTSNFDNFIKFSDDFTVIQMEVPHSMIGKSLRELNLRKNYQVSVLSVIRYEPFVDHHGEDSLLKNIKIIPDPYYRFKRHDKFYLVGNFNKVNQFVSAFKQQDDFYAS